MSAFPPSSPLHPHQPHTPPYHSLPSNPFSTLQADNRRLLTERQALTADIHRLRTQNITLCDTTDELTTQRDSLRAEKAALETANGWLAFDRTQLRTEMWVWRTALDRVRVEKEGLEAEITRLEVENARLGDVERGWVAHGGLMVWESRSGPLRVSAEEEGRAAHGGEYAPAEDQEASSTKVGVAGEWAVKGEG
ncbi:hypothetical protein MMC34_000820 [Xylographa carneopallida]|nr:hypothetical protein [Xylographa carneopallida]